MGEFFSDFGVEHLVGAFALFMFGGVFIRFLDTGPLRRKQLDHADRITVLETQAEERWDQILRIVDSINQKIQ